jgi:hypothetical protein
MFFYHVLGVFIELLPHVCLYVAPIGKRIQVTEQIEIVDFFITLFEGTHIVTFGLGWQKLLKPNLTSELFAMEEVKGGSEAYAF